MHETDPSRSELPASSTPPAVRLDHLGVEAEDESLKRLRLTRIETLLVEREVLDLDQVMAVKDRQRGSHRPFVEVVLEQEHVDEDRLVAVLSEATGFPVAEDDAIDPDPDVQALVPADVVFRLGVLPVRRDGEELIVATGDPFQVPAFDELAQRTGLHVRPLFARPSIVADAIRRARGQEQNIHALLRHSGAEVPDLEFHAEESEPEAEPGVLAVDVTDSDAPTVRLVNLLLADAIRQGASDLHVEAEKDGTRVRMRIDGVLHDVLRAPEGTHPSIVSRFKIIAALDVLETRRPQDGRARVRTDGAEVNLRISTLPSYHGEKVVARILDPRASTFSLDNCGLSVDLLGRWRELVRRPEGLLLMTGPTGSGKTTTLFSTLLEVRSPELNIVTVEDPVEYQFPGIVHVPVRSDIGVTFAAALRSILRQDPDVVLVGEIRDAETAEVAVQAAMTGHLVLSTLHANNAVAVVPRLLDLGIDPAFLSAAMLGVMSQRLVRTVCADCSRESSLSPSLAEALGLEDDRAAAGTVRRGEGCARCRGTGLRGRTAIAELVAFDDELSRAVADGRSASELAEIARRGGTRPIVENGAERVLAGETTPEEVLRVAAREFTGHDEPKRVAPPRDANAPLAAGTSECTDCGKVADASFRFCPNCGHEKPQARDRGPRVLVCDDEEETVAEIEGQLAPDYPSIRTTTDTDVRSLLDTVARERPDLLIIDRSRGGASAVELLEALRAEVDTLALPVILLVGSSDDALESRALDSGADDYLRRPISAAVLRARVRAVLAAASRGRVATD